MDQLGFWKTCCERGISIYEIPKPFKEELICWQVEKHPTFKDRKSWTSSYTFDLKEEMRKNNQAYLGADIEPRSKGK